MLLENLQKAILIIIMETIKPYINEEIPDVLLTDFLRSTHLFDHSCHFEKIENLFYSICDFDVS